MLLRGGQLASRLVLPSSWTPASPPRLRAPAHHQNDGGPGLTPRIGRGHRPRSRLLIPAPSRHRRSTPLLWLLARLGWQRDPQLWTVPCRDVDGRRARLLIRLSPSGITITGSASGPLRVPMLQVGDLHLAIHDAINTFSLLAGPNHPDSAQDPWRDEAPTAPLDSPAGQREVVHFKRAPRSTVRELQTRLGTPPAPAAVDHGGVPTSVGVLASKPSSGRVNRRRR